MGAWFGDYQILLNIPSNWELEAGSDADYSKKHRISGLPPNTILTYTLDKERFLKIVNQYPKIRSFIVTRALVRRAHFTKVFDDNLQVVLLRMKMSEHREKCEAEGIPNDFIEEPENLQDPSMNGKMIVSP